MTIEEFPIKSTDVSDTVLKKKCLDMILESGLPKDKVPRVIPPKISEFLLNNLPKDDSSALLSQSRVPNLVLCKVEKEVQSEIIRDLLYSHTEVLTIRNCSIPSKNLTPKELLCALTENSKLNTMILDNVIIKTNDSKVLKAVGALMERITCLRYITIYSEDSVHQTDEIFAQLARDHLSKNRNLTFVDLKGSDIDLVATNSRRNLPINFAGEMRRWARRLKGLAFETDVSLNRVLRILNRQCPLLKYLCVSPRGNQTVSDIFDNLKSVLDSSNSFEQQAIEPLLKLKRLCLCGNYRITDNILQSVLKSLPNLIYLNISGCAVNFEQYYMHLPPSLEELIIDECDRHELLKDHRPKVLQILQKCPNLIIYVSRPQFEGEDYESLKGLALLNGAKAILWQNFDNLNEIEDDGLISFELRVKELDHKVPCIKLF